MRAIGVARFFSLLDFVLSLSFSFARKTTVLSCLLSCEPRERRTEREQEEEEEEEEEDRAKTDRKKGRRRRRRKGSIVGERTTHY